MRARRARRCLIDLTGARWQVIDASGDTRTIMMSTDGETFYMFYVTVDARGRVTAFAMHTSYGGD